MWKTEKEDSYPSSTRLLPLFYFWPIPFINLPNSFDMERFQCFRVSESSWRTCSLVSVVFPMVSSKTVIARFDGSCVVSLPMLDS